MIDRFTFTGQFSLARRIPQLHRETLPVMAAAGGAIAGFLLWYTRNALDNEPFGYAAPSPQQIAEEQAHMNAGHLASAMLSVGLAGAALGGTLGAAASVARTQWRRIPIGLVLGACLGTVGGIVSGVGCLRFLRHAVDVGWNGVWVSVIATAIFWSPLAMGIGIAVGAAAFRIKAMGIALANSLAAAFLCSLLLPLIGAVVFPLSYKDAIPLQELSQTILLTTVGAALIGLMMYLGERQLAGDHAVATESKV